MTDRNACYAAVEQGEKETCTSKARGTERLANTLRAKKANRDISCLSSERLRTRDWLATRMPANQHCCGKSPQRGPGSQRIRLPRCTRSLASSNFRVIGGLLSRIFLV